MPARLAVALGAIIAFAAFPVPLPLHAPVPGDAIFATGNFDAAERSYKHTLQSDRHNAGAELGLARIALYHNDLSSVEIHARALAADDPNDPRAQHFLAAVPGRRGTALDLRADPLAGEVDITLARIDPLPVLAVAVNGKRARLLLDTGAPGLDLASSFARKLGLATHAAGQAVFAGGLRADVRQGHVDRLDLGNATVRSLPVSVVDRIPPDVDGVLGTNVLYDFLSTIDYRRRRLILRPKLQSAAFERAAAARGATAAPMLLAPDHFIFVRARVGKGPEALFNVDTGGDGIGVQLTKTALHVARIVPDTKHPGSFGGGGGNAHTIPFVTDVTLHNRTWRGVPGLYFDNGDQFDIFPFAVAGTLSHEFFKRGALTLDFTAMRLVFEAPLNGQGK